MSVVPGTQGYELGVARFVETSQALSFVDVCSEILDFLPTLPARVLDVGAGAGQNSAALARLGHSVVAVEPMAAFLDAARDAYSDLPVVWVNDSLPMLGALENDELFDFVLAEAVWQHLDSSEREAALVRIHALLSPGGHLGCSLRNGPPGLGSRVFPTDPDETLAQAGRLGLECVFRKDNLPSFLPNKKDVHWSRLVFQKN